MDGGPPASFVVSSILKADVMNQRRTRCGQSSMVHRPWSALKVHRPFPLLQARAVWYVFGKRSDYGLACLTNRRRNDHALRFIAPQFAWFEIGDNNDFHTDHFFSFVIFSDTCQHLARIFFANIDRKSTRLNSS